ATNKKLSNLSRKPPCPGNICPLSLNPNVLLMEDSNKSPKVPINQTHTDTIIQAVRDASFVTRLIIHPVMMVKSPAPKNPSHVLLGLIFCNNFFLPKREPIKYADESDIQMSKNKYKRYIPLPLLTTECPVKNNGITM